MKNRIIEILSEIRPEVDFNVDVNFFESGLLDSFDVVTLVSALDEEYKISIDGLDVLPDNFSTVNTIVVLLSKYGVK